MRVRVLLPAYNEGEALPRLLLRLAAVHLVLRSLEVVVVNDGSRDNTAAVVRDFASTHPWTRLVNHDRNRGLGVAMRTGIAGALEELSDGDVLVALDSDNTHDPSLLLDMLDKLAQDYDVVVASRFAPGGREVGLTVHRQILSRGASWLMRLTCPVPGVKDYSCGYRAYRVGALRRMARAFPDLVSTANFDCMAQILLRLATVGARCTEVGMILRYDLKGGASKMKVWRTVRGYFRLMRQFSPSLVGAHYVKPLLQGW